MQKGLEKNPKVHYNNNVYEFSDRQIIAGHLNDDLICFENITMY